MLRSCLPWSCQSSRTRRRRRIRGARTGRGTSAAAGRSRASRRSPAAARSAGTSPAPRGALRTAPGHKQHSITHS